MSTSPGLLQVQVWTNWETSSSEQNNCERGEVSPQSESNVQMASPGMSFVQYDSKVPGKLHVSCVLESESLQSVFWSHLMHAPSKHAKSHSRIVLGETSTSQNDSSSPALLQVEVW